MKKLLSLTLALLLLFTLAACGGTDSGGGSDSSGGSSSAGSGEVQAEDGYAEARTGDLVFDVPADEKDFSISHLELFDDDSDGDTFFVFFTAEER